MNIALRCGVAALVLAGVVSAQCTLTITGSVNPGQTVTIGVSGATANDPTVLVISENAGTSTLNLGLLGSLTLGVTSPYIFFPLGITDGTGSVSQSFGVPANIPSLPTQTLQVQAVSVDIPTFTAPGPGGPGGPPSLPTLSFCTSNVAQLQIG